MTYKVLIVDDSKLARMSVSKALSSLRPDWQRLEAGDAEEALARVREFEPHVVLLVVDVFDSKLVPDSLKTLDEQVSDNISNERVIALLSACFAFLALLTTAVGLYGVLAYATAQRTREIGIRMALGAQRIEVVLLVLREIVLVAAVGIGVALPVSVMLSRLMRSQLFGVSPFDPAVLLACVAVTLLMVMMASAIPARRAASVEPTKALRTD